MTALPSDEEMLASWHRFVARQPESVEALLRLVRDQHQQSLSDQQQELQCNDDQFLQVRGFLAPRPDHFATDARAIADYCHLPTPDLFVNLLLLGRGLQNASTPPTWTAYRAAHPAEADDGDEPPTP